MLEKIKQKIINKIFIVSKQPVLFRDLLEANSLYNEGMLVDGAKLNFRFNYARTYQVYSLLVAIVFLPILLIVHNYLTKIDTHISIISTAIVTSVVFIGFDVFKVWVRKEMSQKRIKEAWLVHFPYFSYEKYSKIVDEIYLQSIKENISKNDLEQYLLEKLVSQRELRR
ncbi:hypothetical protein [Campylobacter majalis]|uniref:hypothetical protein n=1 Tax=Campylobacter majalis TaxID=2790656 RepID=UPI003D689595